MTHRGNVFHSAARKLIRLLPSSPDRVARWFPRHGTGAEIGVWKGDFSKRLLAITKPERLYLVDPWLFQPEFPDNGYGGCGKPFRGVQVNSQADMDALHERVKHDLGDVPCVRILRIRSAEMEAHIRPGELDWIYIDGNHAREYVQADLALAWKLVKPGGVIAGDDFNYTKPGSPYGVRTALVEFCNEKDRKITVIGDSQYLVIR